MGRANSAKERWRAEQEALALAHFRTCLQELADPRRRQGLRYPLQTVVVTALMAMVCGADDAEAMQEWGETNEEWLSGFLEMPHGAPTQDVYLSVFAALDPDSVGDVFRSWVQLLKVRKRRGDFQLAVDGKTSRRSFDAATGRPPLHLVSAWLVEQNLVIGQMATDTKSNEITAIPELLALLSLEGATVTIDAMGCQKEIAKQVVEGGGNYLLAVKENQPTLFRDIVASFEDAVDGRRRPLDEPGPLAVTRYEETDSGHGRVEERECLVCTDLSWLSTASEWPGLKYIARVQSRRTVLRTEKVSTECRYFIGSQADVSASVVARRVRNHWGIENGLHWVLDMAFDEDRARHRAGNCAQNLSLLRHVALNLLKAEKTCRLGVPNKRRKAGWDRSYLLTVVAGRTSV